MSIQAPGDAATLPERIYRAMNDGRLDELDQLFAPDFVDHGDGTTGVQALQQRMAAFRSAFPDLHTTVEQVLVDGNFLASRTTTSGTHQESLMGMSATGRQISVPAVDIVRVHSDGRAAERWGGLDTYQLLVQLGAVPGGS